MRCFSPKLILCIIAVSIVTFLSIKRVSAAVIYPVKCDLVILGDVEAGDSAHFKKELSALFRSGCDYSPSIILYSAGGDLVEATNIGRQIHSLYLTTIAPSLPGVAQEPDLRPRNGGRTCQHMPGSRERYQKAAKEIDRLMPEFFDAIRDWRHKKMPKFPHYFDYDPVSGEGDPRCACASACFFMWAAGAEKKGDVIQIHRPYFDQASFAKLNVREAEMAYQELSNQARTYLTAAGVPEGIVERMFKTSSNEASYLSADEIKALSMPPYLAELKLARCGPEPREEDQSNAPLSPELKDPEAILTPQQRRFLIKHAQREICWQNSQEAFRKQAIAAYLRDGKENPTQNIARSGKGANGESAGTSEIAKPLKSSPTNKEDLDQDFTAQLEALGGAGPAGEPETADALKSSPLYNQPAMQSGW